MRQLTPKPQGALRAIASRTVFDEGIRLLGYNSFKSVNTHANDAFYLLYDTSLFHADCLSESENVALVTGKPVTVHIGGYPFPNIQPPSHEENTPNL